jgi:hypothetical protein
MELQEKEKQKIEERQQESNKSNVIQYNDYRPTQYDNHYRESLFERQWRQMSPIRRRSNSRNRQQTRNRSKTPTRRRSNSRNRQAYDKSRAQSKTLKFLIPFETTTR